ncbi:poly(3-hydroxybutyrate) depolymerase-like [Ciona intestinalis]
MKRTSASCVFCYLLISLDSTLAAQLGSYNVDSDSISVSGLSAGGFMSVQMHVAYSKMFMGVGVLAGGPYWCAIDNAVTATTTCMTSPAFINVKYLQQITTNTALTGFIDPVSNMMNDRVFLFSGMADTVVDKGVVKATEDYYSAYVNPEDVMTVYSVNSEHGFPTVDQGGTCDELSKPGFINKCGYDTAFVLLDHIYGNLQQHVYPTDTPIQGSILEFDQTEFFGRGFGEIGLDDVGYVFIPDSCADLTKSCRLHLSLHGCEQGFEFIKDDFIKQSGYNEVAALNDIIVVYPQVKKNVLTNPNGCFDWWGYTGSDYASNIGDQMVALKKMIERVANL